MNDVNIDDIHFLEKWVLCKYDDIDDSKLYSCTNCEHFENCMDDANFAYVGYEMFCDSIIGCGYDSMDEFLECNGI